MIDVEGSAAGAVLPGLLQLGERVAVVQLHPDCPDLHPVDATPRPRGVRSCVTRTSASVEYSPHSVTFTVTPDSPPLPLAHSHTCTLCTGHPPLSFGVLTPRDRGPEERRPALHRPDIATKRTVEEGLGGGGTAPLPPQCPPNSAAATDHLIVPRPADGRLHHEAPEEAALGVGVASGGSRARKILDGTSRVVWLWLWLWLVRGNDNAEGVEAGTRGGGRHSAGG